MRRLGKQGRTKKEREDDEEREQEKERERERENMESAEGSGSGRAEREDAASDRRETRSTSRAATEEAERQARAAKEEEERKASAKEAEYREVVANILNEMEKVALEDRGRLMAVFVKGTRDAPGFDADLWDQLVASLRRARDYDKNRRNTEVYFHHPMFVVLEQAGRRAGRGIIIYAEFDAWMSKSAHAAALRSAPPVPAEDPDTTLIIPSDDIQWMRPDHTMTLTVRREARKRMYGQPAVLAESIITFGMHEGKRAVSRRECDKSGWPDTKSGIKDLVAKMEVAGRQVESACDLFARSEEFRLTPRPKDGKGGPFLGPFLLVISVGDLYCFRPYAPLATGEEDMGTLMARFSDLLREEVINEELHEPDLDKDKLDPKTWPPPKAQSSGHFPLDPSWSFPVKATDLDGLAKLKTAMAWYLKKWDTVDEYAWSVESDEPETE
ncbi:unnamed protein product [Peniophora sp. CBMAI 1063]|nr:unnamed protein product [Peniophora sp. CBMAI 1063]